jgi:hypothetical protein
MGSCLSHTIIKSLHDASEDDLFYLAQTMLQDEDMVKMNTEISSL